MIVFPTLSVGCVLSEMQHGPACPFRVIDSPISHKSKLSRFRERLCCHKLTARSRLTPLPEKWLLVPRCLLVPHLDLSKAIWELVEEEVGPPGNIFLAGVPKPDVVSFAVGLVDQVKFFQIQSADLRRR